MPNCDFNLAQNSHLYVVVLPVFREGFGSDKVLCTFSVRPVQELHTIKYDILTFRSALAMAFDPVNFVILADILIFHALLRLFFFAARLLRGR
jgi:enhancing lycopene biosynthesis protein 2